MMMHCSFFVLRTIASILFIATSTRTGGVVAQVLPDPCVCNTGCFGGVEMTYNRQRCDPATTQPTNTQANDYCEDFTTGGALPTGNVVTERLAIGLYYCDGSDNPFPGRSPANDPGLMGYRNMITDELTFDLNVRNVQTTIESGYLGVCLPDCIQVRLSSYNGNTNPPDFAPRQTFNIDTRCAGNSLVSRTNYGAFYYRQDFNTMCPIGKK